MGGLELILPQNIYEHDLIFDINKESFYHYSRVVQFCGRTIYTKMV